MRRILILIVILVVSQVFYGSVSATFYSDPNKTAVDNREIRWGTFHGSTKWTSARNTAIARWDEEGIINIAGDTASTIEDLSFSDYRTADGFSGFYRYYPSATDAILFNDYYLEKYDTCYRNHTAIHEIGHSLNFAHTTTAGSALRSGKYCQSTLGSYDKSELRRRW